MMFDFFRREPVQKLLADHQSGKQDNHKLLFSLVLFEQWLRSASAGLLAGPVGHAHAKVKR